MAEPDNTADAAAMLLIAFAPSAGVGSLPSRMLPAAVSVTTSGAVTLCSVKFPEVVATVMSLPEPVADAISINPLLFVA